MNDQLLIEITKWSEKYDFSFQFWGIGNNNVFIEKDGVEIFSTGDHYEPINAVKAALDFIYRINRTPKLNRVFN